MHGNVDTWNLPKIRCVIVPFFALLGLSLIGFQTAKLVGDSYFLKAEKLALSSQVKQAHIIIEKAIRWQPWDPAMHYAKGYYLNRLGDFQRADAALTRSYRLAPPNEKGPICVLCPECTFYG